MKIILRIISIIIEIIIASAIFLVIVQKTPLFDRAIPGRSDNITNNGTITSTNSDVSTKDSTNSSIANNNSDNNNLSISPSSSLSISSTDSLIHDQPVKKGKSCTSPRNTSIPDGGSIIAYRYSTSNSNNECLSEIRTCQDGKLGGSYTIRSCSYVVDGQRIQADGTKQDIIAGASDSEQQLVNLSNFKKKLDSTPKDLIQPDTAIKKGSQNQSIITAGKMNNSKIIENNNLSDTLDQKSRQEDHTITKSSCTTPRGKKIAHGTFAYAYDIDKNSLQRSCIVQTRACLDGKLSGSFRYPSCNLSESSSTNPIKILSIAPIRYRGTISPYSPYVRPISENIADTILTTHRSDGGYDTNSQNYIKTNNCLTPRGSTVSARGSVTAYRIPRETSNSLCDSEVRVCRDGVLGGRYTYSSCTATNLISTPGSHTTWIEDAGSWIGNAASDSASRVGGAISDSVDRIGGAVNTVGGWIGSLF